MLLGLQSSVNCRTPLESEKCDELVRNCNSSIYFPFHSIKTLKATATISICRGAVAMAVAGAVIAANRPH